MTFDELLATCRSTTPDDWNRITCWGVHGGPSYLNAWDSVIGGSDDLNPRVELIGSHPMRAALKADLSIGIAWGLEGMNDFKEPWHASLPDPGAASRYVDFFYNGNLVERMLYVTVDGGRANVPIPHRDFDGDDVKAYWITRWEHDFFKTLNALESTYDFDDYLRRVGFEVR